MRDVVQGRDRSVRGIVSKGQFVQGAQHPRTFGLGHIGRGHINPASGKGRRQERRGAPTELPPPSFFVAASDDEGVVPLPGGRPAVALRVAA